MPHDPSSGHVTQYSSGTGFVNQDKREYAIECMGSNTAMTIRCPQRARRAYSLPDMRLLHLTTRRSASDANG